MITPFLIIVNHFFADFLCQTDRMATGKSKSLLWLTIHAATYALAMCPMGFYLDHEVYGHFIGFGWGVGSSWLVINFALHWITDFLTSRWTSHLYRKHLENPKEEWLFQPYVHWFFCVIGLDQVIHYGCLYFTYQYFLN
jgi:Protein of unknown function (DUF3307)